MEKTYYSIIEPIIITAAQLEDFSNKYLFGPLSLTVSSMKILLILNRKGRLTAKEIIKNVSGKKSNISQRLNLLEKKGYIVRYKERNMKDKREFFIELTTEGRNRVKILYKHIRKFKLEFEANFSQKEIEQHFIFFKKLSKIIEIKDKEFTECKCKKFLNL